MHYVKILGVYTKVVKGSDRHSNYKRKLARKETHFSSVRAAVPRKGLQKTTLAEIIDKANVSYSSFQNIFRAKDGVLTELVEFMFSTQFGMARQLAGADLPPVYVYAVETAIQMTLTELNENLREIYIEAYTQKKHPNIYSGKQQRNCTKSSAHICRGLLCAAFMKWR